MITTKEVTWVQARSQTYNGCVNHCAVVNNVGFVTIVQSSCDPTYYIHPTHQDFKVDGSNVYGNQGIEKWGYFESLDECKRKSEELIRQYILSFIDIRDTKINQILDGCDQGNILW